MNSGTSGRGPTIDMSPTRTLSSCGSSSSLVRLRKAPMRVIRGSARTVSALPAREASETIERNLKIRNGRPFLPTRCWRKRTGPGLSNLIMNAMAIRNGSNRVRPAADPTMSIERLAVRVAHEVAAGPGRSVPDRMYLTENVAYRRCDPINLRVAHAGEQRQRDRAGEVTARHGKVAWLAVIPLLPIGHVVQRPIVDRRANTLGVQCGDQIVTVDRCGLVNAYGKHMPGMEVARPGRSRAVDRQSRELVAVALGGMLPR